MRLIVEGQEIRPYSSRVRTASDSVDFVRYFFDLSPEWSGLTLTAQFTQGGNTYNRPVIDGMAILPSEITASGPPVLLSIFGILPGESIRATTIPYQFRVYPSGYVEGGEPSIPPAPDLYQQLLAEIRAAEKAANDAANRAEDAAKILKFDPENAGMLLYIGADGTAQPIALGAGLEIVDGVLRVTGIVTPPDIPDEPVIPVESIEFVEQADGTYLITGVEFVEQADGSILWSGATFTEQMDGSYLVH